MSTWCALFIPGLLAVVLQLFSTDVQAYTCRSVTSGSGREPNWGDEECRSYYQCQGYAGSLKHCPSDSQFHYEYKECMKDKDVFCKWQREYYSVDASSSKSGHDHMCYTEHGREPDYDAENCQTFYECENHQGFLLRCLPGHQFDWKRLDCYKDEEVYCQEQRANHSAGDFDLHTQQNHIETVLRAKQLPFCLIDIATDPSKKDEMRQKCGCETALAPQIFNEEFHCGDYQSFQLAVEEDRILEYLRV